MQQFGCTAFMKNAITYGLTIFWGLFAALFCTAAAAVPEGGIRFETEVPRNFVCAEGSRVSLSGEHFKDGARSLRWSWSAPSQLVCTDAERLTRSAQTPGAGMTLWIYNPEAAYADLRFAFETASGQTPYRFDLHLGFTCWRACWIKYADMRGDHTSQQLARLVISTPEGVPNGELYLDRMNFSVQKLNDRITPDKQIPDNNRHLNRPPWHWTRLWEWEQYIYETPLAEPTPEQRSMLRLVERRLDELVRGELPHARTVREKLLPQALNVFEKARIRRTADGGVLGAPLVSNDECDPAKGDLRNADIERMLYAFACGSTVLNDPQYDRLFLLVFDHAVDQGFAYGSGQGTNHHYGYSVRRIYDAMWLMRDRIAARGRSDEYVRVLAYWSGLQETRRPYVAGRDELLDTWHTLLRPRTVSALMLPCDAERLRALHGLCVWLSGSLACTPGTIGGIKPDGTAFHHGGFYPAYSVGAFAALGDYCRITAGSGFEPSEDARRNLKHALRTLSVCTNLRDWGLGLSGRHPFAANARIPDPDVNAMGYLAALGDLTGSGKSVDPELAADYLRLKGTDRRLDALFAQEGISPAPAPEGFFVLNYGAAGIHRRDDWMVTLKAFNSDVWGSEIYARDNRYGRYQSYGTVQIFGSGTPVTARASGFSQAGWDWNRPPGATTIHLPWEQLESPRPGTLMERNPVRFAGTSSLEGRNGAMAFRLVERDLHGSTPGATARKSVFCFDNRLVLLGSGIDNDNADYPTETTLFQLRLDARNEAIGINGRHFGAFPLDTTLSGGRIMLRDTKGNCYVVQDAPTLRILKQRQTSPDDKRREPQSGDFATALIDHGRAPEQAGYEYAVYIRPTERQIERLRREDGYEVVRRDNAVHAVRDRATGITGYVCFEAFRGAGFIRRIPAETILMERAESDGLRIVSVCAPDLGLTEKTYTTPQPSQPLLREALLGGNWEIEHEHPDIKVIPQDGDTRIVVTCRDGRPVCFRLRKR